MANATTIDLDLVNASLLGVTPSGLLRRYRLLEQQNASNFRAEVF
jgi:hypothetical protein